jgi:hypothetical protein
MPTNPIKQEYLIIENAYSFLSNIGTPGTKTALALISALHEPGWAL